LSQVPPSVTAYGKLTLQILSFTIRRVKLREMPPGIRPAIS